MAQHKRKRAEEVPSEGEDDDFSVVSLDDESDVDIFSALTGKKRRTEQRGPRPIASEDDDDDDLEEIIRASISKRDVKGGTELLKKTKGKAKITKGEVGGGSFQSMGASLCPCNST